MVLLVMDKKALSTQADLFVLADVLDPFCGVVDAPVYSTFSNIVRFHL